MRWEKIALLAWPQSTPLQAVAASISFIRVTCASQVWSAKWRWKIYSRKRGLRSWLTCRVCRPRTGTSEVGSRFVICLNAVRVGEHADFAFAAPPLLPPCIKRRRWLCSCDKITLAESLSAFVICHSRNGVMVLSFHRTYVFCASQLCDPFGARKCANYAGKCENTLVICRFCVQPNVETNACRPEAPKLAVLFHE